MVNASRPRTGACAMTVILVVVLGCGQPTISPPMSQGPSSSSASSPTVQAGRGPFLAGGWSWSPIPALPFKGKTLEGATGLTAYCGDIFASYTVCTSKDGVSWATPADSSVFVQESPGKFFVESVASGPAGYLMSDQFGQSAWRSHDGVHWSAFTPVTSSVYRWKFIGLRDRYLGNSGSSWYESVDGLKWTPVALPHSIEFIDGSADLGLIASGEDVAGDHYWYSSDGRSWSAVVLPAPLNGFLVGEAKTPDGHVLAVATTVGSVGDGVLVETANGTDWTVVATFPKRVPDQLAMSGRSVFVTAGDSSAPAAELWVSNDSGATWTNIVSGSNHVQVRLAYMGFVVIEAGGQTYVGKPT